PMFIAMADVNGNGHLDLLTANAGSGTVSVRLDDGGGGFSGTTANDIAVGSFPASIALADLDGDGDLDLLTANNGGNTVSLRFGDGGGGFSGPPSPALGAADPPISIAVADVNGNGKLDLLAASGLGGTVSVRLGNGDGTFSGTTADDI